MGWRVRDWVALEDWEKQQWIQDETERIRSLNEMMDRMRNDKGELYREVYLPIYLKMLG